MKDIADHIFDILENSINANATEIEVIIKFLNKQFFCQIKDNGTGIKDENVIDPFVTSRKERKIGLGLPLLKRTAEETGGFLEIFKLKNNGTVVKFEIDFSHIDSKPFGRLSESFVDAMLFWPEVKIEILLETKENKKVNIFNNRKIMQIINYFELQKKEIRDFICCSIDQELEKIGINTQFGNY